MRYPCDYVCYIGQSANSGELLFDVKSHDFLPSVEPSSLFSCKRSFQNLLRKALIVIFINMIFFFYSNIHLLLLMLRIFFLICQVEVLQPIQQYVNVEPLPSNLWHLFEPWNEPRHDKTNKMAVRPSKTQISLGIRPVWSESSLSAWRKLGP